MNLFNENELCFVRHMKQLQKHFQIHSSIVARRHRPMSDTHSGISVLETCAFRELLFIGKRSGESVHGILLFSLAIFSHFIQCLAAPTILTRPILVVYKLYGMVYKSFIYIPSPFYMHGHTHTDTHRHANRHTNTSIREA